MANDALELVSNLKGIMMESMEECLKKNSRNIKAFVQRQHDIAIKNDIYKAGVPNWYTRRYKDEGLLDWKNRSFSEPSFSTKGNVWIYKITFYNNTPFNDFNNIRTNGFVADSSNFQRSSKISGGLSQMLNDGYGSKNKWYNKPRPFMDDTKNAFNEKIGFDKNNLGKNLLTDEIMQLYQNKVRTKFKLHK